MNPEFFSHQFYTLLSSPGVIPYFVLALLVNAGLVYLHLKKTKRSRQMTAIFKFVIKNKLVSKEDVISIKLISNDKGNKTTNYQVETPTTGLFIEMISTKIINVSKLNS